MDALNVYKSVIMKKNLWVDTTVTFISNAEHENMFTQDYIKIKCVGNTISSLLDTMFQCQQDPLLQGYEKLSLSPKRWLSTRADPQKHRVSHRYNF